MVYCELISFKEDVERVVEITAESIDPMAVQGVRKTLSRQDTGLISNAAFLYFLDQERLRFETFSHPVSVVLFRLGLRMEGNPEAQSPLPAKAFQQVVQCINGVKRKTDMICHFETFDYALILPNTNAASVRAFVGRLPELVINCLSENGVEQEKVHFSLGFASMPEEAQDVGMLLAVARSRRA